MRDKIIKILKHAGKNGVLQEDFTHIHGISKSTVSTILSKLEGEKLIYRKRVAGKSNRVWHIHYSPFPISGIVRVGILKAIEYPAIFLAAKDSDDQKIIIRIYKNAFSLTKDLAEGYLEAGCSPLITQSMFALVYRSIRIVAGCGFRGGGIVTRVSNPQRFGSSELSTMEYMLRKFAEAKEIDAQIQYFQSPEAMIKSLNRGEVDALAIWEPYLTILSEKYKVLRFDSEFGEYPCCTLSINTRVEDKKEIRNFISRYKNAVNSLPKRRDVAISIESRTLRIKKSDIEKAFDGYTYNWRLDLEYAGQILEDFGIKLTDESKKRIFRLV